MKVSASGMLCEASYELRCAPRCIFQVGRGTGATLLFFFSGDRNTIRKPGPFPQPDFSPPGKPTFSGRFFGSIRSGLNRFCGGAWSGRFFLARHRVYGSGFQSWHWHFCICFFSLFFFGFICASQQYLQLNEIVSREQADCSCRRSPRVAPGRHGLFSRSRIL